MSAESIAKSNGHQVYVLGRSNFAAISAIEGLKLSDESKVRLERTAGLTQKKRREETIEAFRNTTERP